MAKKSGSLCHVYTKGNKVTARARGALLGEGGVAKDAHGGYSIWVEMHATNDGYSADDFDSAARGVRHVQSELGSMCKWYNKHMKAIHRTMRKARKRRS